jgi:hypothetical protein
MPDTPVNPIVIPIKESAKVHKQIEQILIEHNGLESNIGMTHAYWDLQRVYRRLLSEGN